MPELSQIVRQRLASREVGADHPDADTLTAMVEQLLSGAERNRVQEHLAVCKQCREVVALSLGDPGESVPAAVLVPQRRSWRWRPALGLAASLAAMAVVTTVILEMPPKPFNQESARLSPHPPSQRDQDQSRATPATALNDAVTSPDVAGELRARTAGSAGSIATNAAPTRGTAAASSVAAAGAPPPKTAANAVVVANLRESDYVNKQMFVAGQTVAETAANPADVPAAPLPRLTQNQFPPPLSSNTPLTFADLPPQTQNGKVLRSRQLSYPPSNHFGLGLIPSLPSLGRKAEALAKRTVAIPPGALAFSAMESKALSPSQAEPVQNADAANDGNKSQNDLEASNAFTSRALAGADANRKDHTSMWAVAGGRLMRSTDQAAWIAGYAGDPIEFTAVTARGATIWAGGVNAALIHSSDNGATWERITLGATASGSITAIEVVGLTVRVKSSTGQEWSSQDGGRTWTLAN